VVIWLSEKLEVHARGAVRREPAWHSCPGIISSGASDGAGRDEVSHLGQTAVLRQLVLVQPGLNMMVPALTNNMFTTFPHPKCFWCPKAARASTGKLNFSKLQKKWVLHLNLLMRPVDPYVLRVVLRVRVLL